MHGYKKIQLICVLASLLMSIGIAGCIRSGIQVVAVPSTDVLTLGPEDVIQIMQRAGFTDEQIKDHGTKVWEGLAKSGRVQITIRGRTEVIFGVNKDDVIITSLTRGLFIYNSKTGWATNRGGSVSNTEEDEQEEKQPPKQQKQTKQKQVKQPKKQVDEEESDESDDSEE
jgi:hypothetical protein